MDSVFTLLSKVSEKTGVGSALFTIGLKFEAGKSMPNSSIGMAILHAKYFIISPLC